MVVECRIEVHACRGKKNFFLKIFSFFCYFSVETNNKGHKTKVCRARCAKQFIKLSFLAGNISRGDRRSWKEFQFTLKPWITKSRGERTMKSDSTSGDAIDRAQNGKDLTLAWIDILKWEIKRRKRTKCPCVTEPNCTHHLIEWQRNGVGWLSLIDERFHPSQRFRLENINKPAREQKPARL